MLSECIYAHLDGTWFAKDTSIERGKTHMINGEKPILVNGALLLPFQTFYPIK